VREVLLRNAPSACALGRRRTPKAGFALAAVIILVFCMGIVGFAFLHLAAGETKQTQLDLDSQRAFWLAEAGKERALRWMTDQFRPPDFDLDVYRDETGPDGGRYTVRVLVDTLGHFSADKAFVLESVGEYGSRTRRILQRIRMESFAKYAYFTEDERGPGGGVIWFASADRLEGFVHSNGVFHINGSPQFLSRVTSAADHMVGSPSFDVYDEGGWPVGGNDPFFGEGFELNVTPIPLPSETADLQQEAVSGGLLLGNATTIELGVPAPGWLRYRNTPPPANSPWDSLLISSLPSRVVYCNNDVQLSGVLDGELTIASRQDIVIVEDIVYLASDASGAPLPGCDDLLGLVAEDNIIFKFTSPPPNPTDDLKVNAVLMALDTSITAESYNNGVTRGTLTIWGGLIQRFRGAVGTIGAGGAINSGYRKDYHYDPRVTGRTPPAFPLTGVYHEVQWRETWDESSPF
jgi:hypothetical protein